MVNRDNFSSFAAISRQYFQAVLNSTRNEIIKQVFRRGEVLFGGAKTINIDQIKVGSTRERALEQILDFLDQDETIKWDKIIKNQIN